MKGKTKKGLAAITTGLAIGTGYYLLSNNEEPKQYPMLHAPPSLEERKEIEARASRPPQRTLKPELIQPTQYNQQETLSWELNNPSTCISRDYNNSEYHIPSLKVAVNLTNQNPTTIDLTSHNNIFPQTLESRISSGGKLYMTTFETDLTGEKLNPTHEYHQFDLRPSEQVTLLCIDDVNQDTNPDITLTTESRNERRSLVLINNGDNTFKSPVEYTP